MLELERDNNNPILQPIAEHSWESNAVMNATVELDKNIYRLLYRALDKQSRTFPSGKIYHSSYIGYAESNDGINFIRRNHPFIKPEKSYESLGCEDPRITKIDDTYYIFYSAVSEGKEKDLKVKIAGATTKDFNQIKKLGIIDLEGRGKAAGLFPEKINDKFSFLYTQHADTPESTIFYTQTDSIDNMFDKNKWDKIEKIPLIVPSTNAYRGPELGAVPLKTNKGWLLIYCPESFKKEWFIGAILLDLNDPTKIIGESKTPLLKAEKNYEVSGYTNNVVFPSGAVIKNGRLFTYYGGADSGVCLASCNIEELLSSLI